MQHKAVAAAAAGLAAAGVVAASVLVGTNVGGGSTTGTDAGSPPGPTADQADPPTEPTETAPGRQRFAPVAYDDWLTEVPAGFGVSRGLPDDGGDFQRVDRSVAAELCGPGWLAGGREVDAVRDGATGPEYADLRDLRLFADDRAAHRFLARAAEIAAGCPEEVHGPTVWSHASLDPGLAEESLRVVRTYETDGMVNAGADWWDVVRVGNAVLVTATGGEYLPGETLGSGIAAHQRTVQPIIDRMCVFSAGGC
jgi:hypothetical protein